MPITSHFPNSSTSLLSIKHESSSFSGPLPPPVMLREYNEVQPGMADRIVAMAEKQSAHRLEIENKGVTNEIALAQRGQWCAIVFAVLSLPLGNVFGFTGTRYDRWHLCWCTVNSYCRRFSLQLKSETQRAGRQGKSHDRCQSTCLTRSLIRNDST